jgi:hypothetical protein
MPDELIRRAGHVLRPDPKCHPDDHAFRCDGCGGDLEVLRRARWPQCPHPEDPPPAGPEAWEVLDWNGDIAVYIAAFPAAPLRSTDPLIEWTAVGPWEPFSMDGSGCTNVAFRRPLRRKE